MVYPRNLFPKLFQYIDNKEIVVVTGMRRVGKTTLLRTLFDRIQDDNKVFLDIENPIEQKIFEETDFNNIWENVKPFGINKDKRAYFFLDEIQAKPEIVKAIKYLYDHYEAKFFCTGSSSFYLKNLFSESLAGRKVIYELYPLTFEEFLVFKGVPQQFGDDFGDKEASQNFIAYEKNKKLYDEYLTFGGFPQVVLSQTSKLKKEMLVDIFKSYFEKDVRSLADFKDISVFRDLLLLLMQRVGSRLEITKLSSELGISRPTVNSYLAFLQGTYFIDLIAPYTQNVDRELSGTKKIYFCDSGIISQFAKVTDGTIFENAVYLNARKYGKVQYYQKRSGAEIDFIIAERNLALEAKIRGVSSDYRKLKRATELLGLEKSYVVSKEFVNEKGFIHAGLL